MLCLGERASLMPSERVCLRKVNEFMVYSGYLRIQDAACRIQGFVETGEIRIQDTALRAQEL